MPPLVPASMSSSPWAWSGGAPPDRIVEVGIAAVDDDVALGQSRQHLLDGLIHRRTGGDHEPDHARGLQAAHEVGEIFRALRAFARELGDGLGASIPRHDLVPVPEQAADHVATHPPEAHHRQSHDSRLP